MSRPRSKRSAEPAAPAALSRAEMRAAGPLPNAVGWVTAAVISLAGLALIATTVLG